MHNFAVNTNPYGPPPAVLDLLRNSDCITTYPSSRSSSNQASLAKIFQVNEANIAVGIGTTQLLFDIPRLITYARAIIPVPTFWEYKVLNERFAKEIKTVELSPENDFTLDLESLETLFCPGDAVFLCNVNNPTSQLIDKQLLATLIMRNPQIQFIVDETYLMFRTDFSEQSIKSEIVERKNLYIVVSISKFFTVPGVRVGALLSAVENIQHYNNEIDIPYSVSALSQAVIDEIARDDDFITASREKNAAETAHIYMSYRNALDGRVRFIPPQGNFVLGKLLGTMKSVELLEKLSRIGIIIRGGHQLTNLDESWFRICIKIPEENQFLLKNLIAIIQ